MSRPTSSKSKPPPWIPPGKGMPQYKKRSKPMTVVKSKKEGHDPIVVSPQISPQWHTVEVPNKEMNKDTDADMMSLSSHSSYELERVNQENEFDIHRIFLIQEMKLFHMHFASLKTFYLSAHRLIDYQDIDDSNVNDLFIEAGSYQKTLNALFDDYEYSVSVLENTLNKNQRKVEFSTVLKNKGKLLSNLLEMYEKLILIFQVVFEKQDFKEALKAQETLIQKLKTSENKRASQEAVITDLERRLSIYQSKAATMESYKTNFESAKTELERMLLQKESQIKYLNAELMDAPGKYVKSDREDFIEIIEGIKNKAHNEKSALKKALKFSKAQSEKKEETYKKLLQEADEKEKMMFDLASQRDHLKVQLTVVNNNIIQLKHQIEEMKIQNLKLENEITEKEVAHKKETAQLKYTIEEKSTELEESLKKKKKLEVTVVELENELEKSKEHFKVLKSESDIPKQLDSHTTKETSMHEEISRLVVLLQSTRETFENLIHSGLSISASGDHNIENTEFGSNQREILVAVSDTKKYILELKNQLLTFLRDQKETTEPRITLKTYDLEKELKKKEHKLAVKGNEYRKCTPQDRRHLNVATSAVQNTENSFSADISNGEYAKNLQLELYKKDSEIANLKFELAQREKDLENELTESKDKLRRLMRCLIYVFEVVK